MGLIDEAIELRADAYEEMIKEYKRIKYELMKGENKTNEDFNNSYSTIN